MIALYGHPCSQDKYTIIHRFLYHTSILWWHSWYHDHLPWSKPTLYAVWLIVGHNIWIVLNLRTLHGNFHPSLLLVPPHYPCFRWSVISYCCHLHGTDAYPSQQGSWGQHGVHLGPTGPRWTPCWPHELCYMGYYGNSTGRPFIRLVSYILIIWLSYFGVFCELAREYLPRNIACLLLTQLWQMYLH